MRRVIRLYGRLKKQFGPEFQFDVDSPAEAIRAMLMLVPGFEGELRKGAYKVVRGNRQTGVYLDAGTLALKLGGTRELHLIPAQPNAKSGVGKIILGAVIIGTAIATGGATLAPFAGAGGVGLFTGSALGVMAANFGVMMMLGGLSALLTPKVKPHKSSNGDRQDQSFLFGGAQNTASQGVAVPIVYGRVRAGSVIVSAGLDVAQIATQTSGTGPVVTNPTTGATTSTTADGVGDGTGVTGGGSRGTWRDDSGLSGVVWEKGGKSGADTSSTPQEGPNTLQSNATAQFIDLVSEGPCVGLADRTNPMKSVYIDDVPLQAPDGTYNYKGIQVVERLGNPADDPVTGFSDTENERSVNIKASASVSPVVSINDTTVTSCRVKIMLPALMNVDTKDGSVDPTSVQFTIQVQPSGGSYQTVLTDTISGKTNSQYEKAYKFALPGTGPWNVKLIRVTPDSTQSTLQNETWFESLTEIVDVRLQYPNSAYLAVSADAKQFGSSIPTRSYDWKGRIVSVPANYDPTTRTYATSGAGTSGGVWDGTFKQAWTDNPAWVLYDLLTSNRYGLGDDIPATYYNKFSLYEIAQYCDGLVPAYGGGTEPRYTVNTQIVDRGEAWNLLVSIVSVFRGMFYWGAGELEFSYDHDQTPTKLISKANVIDGKINYSSDNWRSRHSVAIVSWNDPELGHRVNYEMVEDNDLITKYGYKQIETTAWGCTSRGQARRVGRWLLDTEKYGELVQFSVALDNADVRPGTVIEINDPEYTTYRNAGRLGVGSTTTTLVLDTAMTIAASGGTVKVILADGTVAQASVTNGAGSTTTLTLSAPLASVPLDGAMWSFAESGTTPRLWRVLTVEEHSPMEFTVTAIWHDPNKFARVESNINLSPNAYSDLTITKLPTPTNPKLTDVMLNNGDTSSPGLLASWTAPSDPRVNFFEYQVKLNTSSDWGVIGSTPRLSAEIRSKLSAANYDMRVRAASNNGNRSLWKLLDATTLTGGRGALASVTGLAFSVDPSTGLGIVTWGAYSAAGDYRAVSYEVLYHATSTSVGSAARIGLTKSLQFPAAVAGNYFVRAIYAGVVGSASMIAVSITSFPVYNVVSDNVLSPVEKSGVLATTVASLETQYSQTLARAAALSLSTTALTAARTNWQNLLATYSPAWNDTTSSTTIYTPLFGDESFPTNWTNAAAVSSSPPYTTVTDSSTTLWLTSVRAVAHAGAATVSFGLVVKKDTVPKTTRNALLRLIAGGVNSDIAFATDTGEASDVASPGNMLAYGSLDLGSDWLIWGTVAAPVGTTTVEVDIYPAVGNTSLGSYTSSATGSIQVRGAPLLALGTADKLGYEYLIGVMNAYELQLEALQKTISETDASTSTWTGVSGSGKPEDNATLGANLATNVTNATQDFLPSGSTYGRALITRLNAGRPTVDFGENIHSNQNLVNNALVPATDKNRIRYSQFESGTKGWIKRLDAVGATLTVGSNNGRRFIRSTGTFTAAGQAQSVCTDTNSGVGYWVPVRQGEWLCVQGWPRVDTCPAGSAWSYNVAFLDTNGSPINGSTQVIASGTGTLAPEVFHSRFVQAPAGACYAFIEMTLTSGATGTFDYSLYDPMLSGAIAGQTAVPSFNPGPDNEYAAEVTTGKSVDILTNGSTYGRTLLTRLNAGKPTIDFSEGIHANQTQDFMPDGTSYARFPVATSTGTGTSRRALIDFTQGHSNKSQDNIPSGSTYGQVVLSRLSSGKPLIDFAEPIHLNQGALSKKNSVDPSTSDIKTTGSIPPTVPGQQFTYTVSNTGFAVTGTISWPTITLYRADGTSVTVASGSQNFSGLSTSSNTYKVYPYVVDSGGTTGTVAFVTSGTGTPSGTPAIFFNGVGDAGAAANMYARGNIALGGFQISVPSSGGGSGGGGGFACLHPDMVVGDVRADALREGDRVACPDGTAPIVWLGRRRCADWLKIFSGEAEVACVTPEHRFYRANGEEVRARELRLGDLLASSADHVEVTGLMRCDDVADLVSIELPHPHLYYAGPLNLLCHNVKP